MYTLKFAYEAEVVILNGVKTAQVALVLELPD